MAQRVTAAVVWMLHRAGHTGVIGQMDDFAIFADSPRSCRTQFDALERLLTQLGFTPHPPGAGESKRSAQPRQQLVLVGILWDSTSMTMRLDSGKIERIRVQIAQFRAMKTPTLLDAQRLGGLLSWAADLLDGGRTFTQRFWRATAGLSRPHHRYRLTKQVHLDLDWWDNNLEKFNGQATPLPLASRRPIIRIATDATGDGDVGIWYDGAFVHLREAGVRAVCPEIPPGAQHVQVWEAEAPLCAFRIFRPLFGGAEIHCLTDNTGARAAFSKGASKHDATMSVLRAAFWDTRAADARIIVGWIPGKSNPIADAISRLHERGQPARLRDLIRHEHAAGRLGGNPPGLRWLVARA